MKLLSQDADHTSNHANHHLALRFSWVRKTGDTLLQAHILAQVAGGVMRCNDAVIAR